MDTVSTSVIYGLIANMHYLNDDDLASIIIEEQTQSNCEGNIFTLTHKSDDSSVDPQTNVIEIHNLNSFRLRLQEAFNYHSLVSIYCENNHQIKSLVIVANQTEERFVLRGGPSGGGNPPICRYGTPPCP